MKMTLKLYAQLGSFLPDNREANEAEIAIEPGETVESVLNSYNVPPEMCHLVLVNGNYIEPSSRATREIEEDDHLAVWPPVAGG